MAVIPCSYDVPIHGWTAQTDADLTIMSVGVVTTLKLNNKPVSKFDLYDFSGGKGSSKSKFAAVLTALEIEQGSHPASLQIWIAPESAGPITNVIGKTQQLDSVAVEVEVATFVKDQSLDAKDPVLKKQLKQVSLKGTMVANPSPLAYGPRPYSGKLLLQGFEIKLAPLPSSSGTKVSFDPHGGGSPENFIWG